MPPKPNTSQNERGHNCAVLGCPTCTEPSGPLRLLVDFNEIRDERVRGLQEYATGPREVREGDLVLLSDEENEALGRVEDVNARGLIRVLMDWATWGAAGRFQFASGVWRTHA